MKKSKKETANNQPEERKFDLFDLNSELSVISSNCELALAVLNNLINGYFSKEIESYQEKYCRHLLGDYSEASDFCMISYEYVCKILGQVNDLCEKSAELVAQGGSKS